MGPEDCVFDQRGRLSTGLADGTILRLDPRSTPARLEVIATTGGRPLGIDLDSEGTLWVADSELGLLSIGPQGRSSIRCRTAGGVPVHYANGVTVGPDGRVYFSDASTEFGPEKIALDALEARPHGRLLRYDPRSDRAEVLLDDLYFANGVAVSADGRVVLVAETFRYRIRRYWLEGPRAGADEILIDRLPGFPDGISTTDRGTFWVAFYRSRNRLLDRWLQPRPWLKRWVARLPRALLVDRDRYGLVLEIDGDGKILRGFEDPRGEHFWAITSVEEHAGKLYVASMAGNALGIVSIEP